MAFTPKDWKDSPDTSTPLSAAAIEDLETRVTNYSDTVAAAVVARYHTVIPTRSALFTSASSNTYVLQEGATSLVLASATGSAHGVLYLDPADLAYGSLTTKYRVQATLLANATAPTINFTVGLYPVSAAAGGAGAMTITLGTVTSGSTVAFTTPSASTRNNGNSGDFTAPAAGYYALGVVASGSQAANSAVVVSARVVGRAV